LQFYYSFVAVILQLCGLLYFITNMILCWWTCKSSATVQMCGPLQSKILQYKIFLVLQFYCIYVDRFSCAEEVMWEFLKRIMSGVCYFIFVIFHIFLSAVCSLDYKYTYYSVHSLHPNNIMFYWSMHKKLQTVCVSN